jgi:MFS family permease
MTILRSLAHRNFRLFFIGQGLSLIGTWMQTTAMAWLVNRLTAPPGGDEGSPFWLTLVVFANQIPGLLLGPFSGVVADRLRRRPILYATQTLMMLQAFVLAWLAYTHTIQIWHILALGAFLGVVSTFDVTTRQAFLTQMIGGKEDLANAIALNSSLFNGARLVGPSLAGLLLWLGGGKNEDQCFFLNGLSYLAVLAGLWMMRLHEPRPRVLMRGWHAMMEGARYAFGSRPIRAILGLVAVVSLVGTPYAALLPIFAVHNLQGGAGTLGLLTAAAGVGALAGALYMAARKTVLGLGRLIAIGPAVFGVGLVAFALSTTAWVSLPALAVMGFAMMVQMAASNTILQTIVDEDKRGRIMSFYATAFLGLAPIGALVGGMAAEAIGAAPAGGAFGLAAYHVGASATVAVGGVICIAAAAVFAVQLPRIREHVRPIYRRIGILPELAQGIQEASDPRTGAYGAAPLADAPEDGIQRLGEMRLPSKD